MDFKIVPLKFLRSYDDTRVFSDRRLLQNFNKIQDFYIDTNQESYFDTIQNDLEPYMRKAVVSWMLEVCEEEKCDSLVFPLATYILDKFLSIYPIKRNMFQLFSCVCLFISSKIFNIVPLNPQRLVYFSDNSIRERNIIVSI